MKQVLYEDFKDFLKSKDIQVVGSLEAAGNSDTREVDEAAALGQLALISEFHIKTMGYSCYIGTRLNNTTGKKVEDYKIHLKKFKRDLVRLEENGPSNSFEKLILEKGSEYAQRAEACIETIYNSDYYELITRSMRRMEICIGDPMDTNLRKGKEIGIVDLKHCSYNMVECDAAFYIGKLKHNGSSLDWKKLIDEFCEYEELDSSSADFIKALVSYPYNIMRCYNRYKYRKKDWTDEEYERRLIRAFDKDGASLIQIKGRGV